MSELPEMAASEKLRLSQEELQGWKVSGHTDEGTLVTARVPVPQAIRPEDLNETDVEQMQGLMYLSDEVVIAINRYQHTVATTKHLPADDIDRAKRRAVLGTVHDVIQQAQLLARTLAINNVKGNHLSRVEVARLLGVHQATVARWVKEAANQQAEPDTE
jgi:hypothetical protein